MAKRASKRAPKRRQFGAKKRKTAVPRRKPSAKKRSVGRPNKTTATSRTLNPHLPAGEPGPAPIPAETSSSPTPTSTSAQGEIRVRMYRQGLGDCFLVTLPKQDGSSFYLMIDCGVILGTADATNIMNKVVANIIGETHGYVDLLVVTHEHWDHVSGFIQAGSLFTPGGKKSSPTGRQ